MPGLISSRIVPALGLVLGLLLLAPGMRAAEEATAPLSSLQVFEALYFGVETAVAAGRLPAGIGEVAEGLVFDLERELIRRDAEIEVLRLEAARFDGERQQQALDRLIVSAASRERRVMEQIRRLEEIAGMSAGTLPAAGVHPESAAMSPPEDARGAVVEAAGDDESRSEKRKLEIVFEAEDSIEDPDP